MRGPSARALLAIAAVLATAAAGCARGQDRPTGHAPGGERATMAHGGEGEHATMAHGGEGEHATMAHGGEGEHATMAHGSSAAEHPRVTRAVAVLHPTEGNQARGVISFEARDDGAVVVAGTISGLSPGEHGFHVHEHGDCSAPDAASAGGHWNPGGRPHGGPGAPARHAGDLGNVVADDSGRAEVSLTDRELALSGPRSIVGRALVVHAEPDDLRSDPAGASGPRIGCGVVGLAAE